MTVESEIFKLSGVRLLMFIIFMGLFFTAGQFRVYAQADQFNPFTLMGIVSMKSSDLPALMVFYSTTCPVCDDFFKGYIKEEETLLKSARIALVAIDKDPKAVTAHAAKWGFKANVMMDPERRIVTMYKGKSTPHLVLADGAGYLQYSGGSMDMEALKQSVSKLGDRKQGSAFKSIFDKPAPPSTGVG